MKGQAPLVRCWSVAVTRSLLLLLALAVPLSENTTEVGRDRKQRECFGRNNRAVDLHGFGAAGQIEAGRLSEGRNAKIS